MIRNIKLLIIFVIVLSFCQFVGYDNKINMYKQISCGYWHNLTLDKDGTVYACGANWYGQLGDNTNTEKYFPIPVKGLNNIVAVACGATHSIAADKYGLVFSWGNNYYHQLGDGTGTNRRIPTRIMGLINIVAISCGENHCLALKDDGTIWAWGSNTYGQLGDGTRINQSIPNEVAGLKNIKSIACGANHSIAIEKDGTVWTWGSNSSGQLGNGTLIDQLYPNKIEYLSNISSACGGHSFSIAVKKDGTIYGWGSNGNGQLGIEGGQVFKNPICINSINNVKSVSCGYCHSIALLNSGHVIAWGGGTFLGDFNTYASYKLIPVYNLKNVTYISANNNYCMAIKNNNTILAWGQNWKGQLGNGTTKGNLIPMEFGRSNSYFPSNYRFTKKIDTQASLNKRIKTTLIDKQWGIRNYGQIINGLKGVRNCDINIVPVWSSGKKISSVYVGILDSGICTYNDCLKSSIYHNINDIPNNFIDDDENGYIDDTNGWNFYNDNNIVYNSKMKDSHGTKIASIIAANDEILGAAPNAVIVPLKITIDNGEIDIISIIKAIEYAQDIGVNIFNCSFGLKEFNCILKNIIEDSNALFICAAGNNGRDLDEFPIYPGCYDLENIICVAAVNNRGVKEGNSNYGEKAHIAAPGESIICSIPDNGYVFDSGTSFANAFVTGSVALLKGINTNRSIHDLSSAVINSATYVDDLKGKVLANGIINTQRAVEYLDN